MQHLTALQENAPFYLAIILLAIFAVCKIALLNNNKNK